MVLLSNSLVFWAAVTFFTPLIIAVLPVLRVRPSERVLHLMLGFSAGILGGVTFIDILPEAFAATTELMLPSMTVSFGVGIGFLTLLIVERYLLSTEQAHGGSFHIHETVIDPSHGPVGLSALSVHGFIDGFVIPISLLAGATIGAVITLAVAIHQIPDTFAALALALSTTQNKRRAFFYVLITAFDTPIGIAFGSLVAGLSNLMIPLGLGISAGTFVFVSASDVVPELQHKTRGPLVIVSMISGFLLVAALSQFLPKV